MLYSERLNYGTGAMGIYVFTTPEKKRAIVQTCAFTNTGSVPATIYVKLHGVMFGYLVLPVAQNVQWTGLRLVLYERETLSVQVTGATTHFLVTGYMFDDDRGNTVGPPAFSPNIAEQLPELEGPA